MASIPIVTSGELGLLSTDPAFIADPYPVYRRRRVEQPVPWSPGTRRWLISRHADVDRVLRDRLRRVPQLELVEVPRWKATFVLRGLEALRVRV